MHTILIITSKRDSHIGPAAAELVAAGLSWVRLNTEDLATNVEVNIEPAKGNGKLTIRDSGKTLNLADVVGVWYRKPDPVQIDHFDLDPAAKDYVEAELNEILLGLYALLNRVPWINDPFTTRIAHRKLLQLRTAVEVGFRVPETLVTNSPAEASGFHEAVGGDLAIKSLGAISVAQGKGDHVAQYGIFTRRVGEAELSEFGDKVANMPTMFQKFIRKKSELRITCVGDKVFACRIHTRSDDITNDDYRFDTQNLKHTAIEIPELTDRLHAYMKAFGLNFGCFDFIVPEEGEPIFLECNCNGQWLWIEKMAGLPISSAVADFFINHARRVSADSSFLASSTETPPSPPERAYWGEVADDAGRRVRRRDYSVDCVPALFPFNRGRYFDEKMKVD